MEAKGMNEGTDLPITPEIKGRKRNKTQSSKLQNGSIKSVFSWPAFPFFQALSDLLTILNENMTSFYVGRAQPLAGPAYIICKLYLTSELFRIFLPSHCSIMASAPYNPSMHVKGSWNLAYRNKGFHPQQDRIFLISLKDYRVSSVSSSEIRHKIGSSELSEDCNLQRKLLTRLKFSVLKCKVLLYVWLLCAKLFLTIL